LALGMQQAPLVGGMQGEASSLQAKVQSLELALVQQERRHAIEVQRFDAEIQELRRLAEELVTESRRRESVGRLDSTDHFTKRVEWTISNFLDEEKCCQKGQPIWSPTFRAAGMDGLRLEFLPKGREKSFDGFCSLFLWCPNGTNIKYQLWVGSYLRAPDVDEYQGDMGHGHSNFCPLEP